DVQQHRDQRDDRQEGRGDAQAAHREVDEPAPLVDTRGVLGDRQAHTGLAPAGMRPTRQTRSRAPMLRSRVTRNSSRPSSVSADSGRPDASGYWFAIWLASVCAGANSDHFRCELLPITIVTAIVSPRARPRPSRIAPTRPDRTYGMTAWRTASQRVAPS